MTKHDPRNTEVRLAMAPRLVALRQSLEKKPKEFGIDLGVTGKAVQKWETQEDYGLMVPFWVITKIYLDYGVPPNFLFFGQMDGIPRDRQKLIQERLRHPFRPGELLH